MAGFTLDFQDSLYSTAYSYPLPQTFALPVKRPHCVVRGTSDKTRGKAPVGNQHGTGSAAQRRQWKRSGREASACREQGRGNPGTQACKIDQGGPGGESSEVGWADPSSDRYPSIVWRQSPSDTRRRSRSTRRRPSAKRGDRKARQTRVHRAR